MSQISKHGNHTAAVLKLWAQDPFTFLKLLRVDLKGFYQCLPCWKLKRRKFRNNNTQGHVSLPLRASMLSRHVAFGKLHSFSRQ